MAGRRGNVKVKIDADTDGVHRGTRSAEKDLSRLQRVGGRTGKALKTGLAGAAVVAGAGLAVGLKKSSDAAIESEKSQAKLRAQLKALGIDLDKHQSTIDSVISKHSQLSGFDDEDLQDSFTNIVRTTGDVNKALELNALAMDLARAKHIDVAKAGDIVAKVAGGNTGVLSRYGITIDKGATSTEALGVLQEKFAGQAEAYGKTTAGSLDRASVASENLGELVGSKLTPLLAKGATALVNVAEAVQRAWPRISEIANNVFGAVKRAIDTARNAITGFVARNREDINSFLQGVRNVATVVRAVFEGVVIPLIRRLLPAIKQIFQGAVTVIRGAVRLISGILTLDFGKAWEGVKDIFRGALQLVGGLLRAATAPMRHAASTIGKAISGPFKAAWDAVKDAFAAAIQFMKNRIADVLTIFREMFRALGKIWIIGDKFDGVANSIQRVQDKLRGTRDEAKKLVPLLDQVAENAERAFDAYGRVRPQRPGALGSGPQYRATGGFIAGSGSGDTVPAMLEPGEYVVRKSAVRAVGRAFMDRLNSGGGRRSGGAGAPVTAGPGRPRGFRSGGPVTATASGGVGGIGMTSLQIAAAVANATGLRVGSNYRTPEHNAAVGGVPNSWHTRGTPSNPGAVDLNGPPANLYAGSRWAAAHVTGLAENMVHDAGTGLHLHLAFAGARLTGTSTAAPAPGTSSAPAPKPKPKVVKVPIGKVRGRSRGKVPKAPPMARLGSLAWIEQHQALAGLTPELSDDLSWAQQLERFWTARLASAQKSGNTKKITEAAQNLAGARESVASLIEAATAPQAQAAADAASAAADAATAAAEAANAALQELLDIERQRVELERQRNAEVLRALAVSQAQYPAFLAGLIDSLNGQLGDRLATARAVPSAPGRLAAY